MAKWSKRSKAVRAELHPDAQQLVDRAQELSPVDFMLIDGARTKAEQILNMRKGVSKTLISAHLPVAVEGLPGVYSHALDFVPLVDVDKDGDDDVTWIDKHFVPVANAFRTAARQLDIRIIRGIDWGATARDPVGWDAGHIELADSAYKWKARVKALWA